MSDTFSGLKDGCRTYGTQILFFLKSIYQYFAPMGLEYQSPLRKLIEKWKGVYSVDGEDTDHGGKYENRENKKWIAETRNQENMPSTIFFSYSFLAGCTKMRNWENSRELRLFTSYSQC